MSDLGYLERLLDGATLEWLPLGQVVKILRGKRLTKSELSEDEEYPVYHGGLDPLGYYGEANRPANSVMVINVGASAGTVGFSSVDFWSSDGCFTLAHADGINSKFLYHFLIGHEHHIKGQVRVAGIPTLDAFVVEKILIPIPCPDDQQKSLAIQAEIVRILDAFTALTAELTTELTTELTARKTQYNHYRNQLLSFEDGAVEWKTLGEVATFRYGLAAKAKDIGDARFIRISDIDGNGQLIADGIKFVDLDTEAQRYILKRNDLLMARTGATFGKTMIFREDYPAVFAGFLIKIDFESAINPRYYWHFAQSSFFWDQANSLVSGGGQPQFNANALQSVKFPIPFPNDPAKSLVEQERIVAILDRFDTITTSLTEGLPREIALRQKQYEYYRNLLLSFPKGGKA